MAFYIIKIIDNHHPNFFLHLHLWSGGTSASTYSIWAPHPVQLGFPHLGHFIFIHIGSPTLSNTINIIIIKLSHSAFKLRAMQVKLSFHPYLISNIFSHLLPNIFKLVINFVLVNLFINFIQLYFLFLYLKFLFIDILLYFLSPLNTFSYSLLQILQFMLVNTALVWDPIDLNNHLIERLLMI